MAEAPTSAPPCESVVGHNDRAHLVEQEFSRHTPQESDRFLQSLKQRAHVLTLEKPKPQQPRVVQHQQQRVPTILREAEVRKVDLRLVTRCRLEANHRLARRRTNPAHVLFRLRVAAFVTRRLEFHVHPHRAQQRDFLQS